jgi:hypothetical protein
MPLRGMGCCWFCACWVSVGLLYISMGRYVMGQKDILADFGWEDKRYC